MKCKMPSLPLIQRPESVASEKKSYRLSLNDCQKDRRCKTYPGNEENGGQLIDNEVNNEVKVLSTLVNSYTISFSRLLIVNSHF